MNSNAFCGALSLLPAQVPAAGTGNAFPWPGGAKSVKFLELDWNLEHRYNLKRCISGKANFSICLIRCWCLFGFPQQSLILMGEWMWRLAQCAESIQVQCPEESNTKYHLWEATWALCSLILQARVSLPVKNHINKLCSRRIPSFEVQVRMENKPCLLPLCSECVLRRQELNRSRVPNAKCSLLVWHIGTWNFTLKRNKNQSIFWNALILFACKDQIAKML